MTKHASVLAIVVLAGCGGGGFPPPHPTFPPTPTPEPSASSSPNATPTPTPSTTPASGGSIPIPIPTPAIVVCSPSLVTVRVGQEVDVVCSAAGYGGQIAASVSNPSIASVVSGNPNYPAFVVTGIIAGTTTLELTYNAGGHGTDTIIVSN